MTSRTFGLWAVGVAFLADQVTKEIILANSVTFAQGVSLFPGFNLVFHRNSGVSFGLLAGMPWWILAILSAAIVLFLAVSMLRANKTTETIAYGSVIGGALGNILDRIRFGSVTDFLDFYIGNTHWPTFNLADVFIVCGVGLLLIAVGREKPAR